jgi:hypothetical protein
MKEIIMSTFIRSALIAVALLSSVSAASARSRQAPYDNATPRNQIDLNSTEGARAFWESQQRHGS